MGVGQSDRDSARVPVRGHDGGQTKRGRAVEHACGYQESAGM